MNAQTSRRSESTPCGKGAPEDEDDCVVWRCESVGLLGGARKHDEDFGGPGLASTSPCVKIAEPRPVLGGAFLNSVGGVLAEIFLSRCSRGAQGSDKKCGCNCVVEIRLDSNSNKSVDECGFRGAGKIFFICNAPKIDDKCGCQGAGKTFFNSKAHRLNNKCGFRGA